MLKTLGHLDRRAALAGISGLAIASALPLSVAAALARERSALFDEIFAKLSAGRSPTETAQFSLVMPEQSENGNLVQFKLAVDSPMTEADHVQALHLLSTLNPQAHVATFRPTLLSGRAAVTGRMRLAKTQDVVALADLSDGRLLMTIQNVSVAIGGCGL